MVLEHHLLLGIVHEHVLVLLAIAALGASHGSLLSVQREGHSVSKLVAGHLHHGGVASADHGVAISRIVIRSRQIGSIKSVTGGRDAIGSQLLVRTVHPCCQLPVAALYLVHLVINIVVVITKTVIAAEARKP